MSWYDDKGDFGHLLGDPAGYVSGVNKGGFKGVMNMLKGDPESAKAAYDAQIQASRDSQAQLQQFLMQQKGAAQGIYAPMQHMFQSAYGTEGIKAPQIPQGSFAKTYGGK